MKQKVLLLISATMFFSACRKDKESLTADPALQSAILADFGNHVAIATYSDLKNKSATLFSSIQQFVSNGTENELSNCKQLWKESRSAWEQSEGFLFGPVATDDIDPRIDTWPVNYADLDSVLASSAVFTDGFIDSLEDALRGFHPMEYLLFGTSGSKTALQFTAREKEYLSALASNLKKLATNLCNAWLPSSGNYYSQFVHAGEQGSVFSSRKSAFLELTGGMSGICDEVANGKMQEPFAAQDPTLEESPFSKNSITDFTDNIRSVQNVYLGRYSSDGSGLEDLVRQYNLNLDNSIKQKITTAISALGNITDPFGQAIFTQPTQIINAQNAINALKDVIENDLTSLVQQRVN